MIILAAATYAPAATPAATPDVIVQRFLAAGQEQPLHLVIPECMGPMEDASTLSRCYEKVRIPLSARSLSFTFGENPEASKRPIRLQYRLEGWDEEWKDLEGLMWLSLRFLDADGRRISSESLPRTGQSPGWMGHPDISPFRTAVESVVAPPRARRMQVHFISGGSPHTTGLWVVKGLRLYAQDQGSAGKLLLDERFQQGADLDQPEGSLADWRREGTNSRTPRIFSLRGPPVTPALALVDTDVRNSGSWVGAGRNVLDVNPGQKIRVETDELFSIGRGGEYSYTYQKLAAGIYTFHVVPVDECGRQSGTGVRLPIEIVPPFYARWWSWTGLLALGAGLLTGTARYLTWKKLQKRLERSERERTVERERTRIAQDIHDDMGARLTQMSLMSSLALQNTGPDDPRFATLQRLDRTAREVASTLDEIVWAVNPAHDTLAGLGDYLSQFVTEFTAESTLRCRLEIPALLPPRFMSSGVRHHLLMAVKEAVHNALKHSDATELRIQLDFADPRLVLVVADNGRGFSRAAIPPGNGLANMNRRLEAVGGTCAVASRPDGGTQVTFALVLPPAPSP